MHAMPESTVIDLVYVEPGSGRWVVADFKTDQVVLSAYAKGGSSLASEAA